MTFNVELIISIPEVLHEPAVDVTPDFVDGIAFGDVIAIGMFSVDGFWTLQKSNVNLKVNVSYIS